MKTGIFLGIGVGFIVLVVLVMSCFVIKEGEQAILVQFGRPIGDSITKAGLYFKIPFIQEVRIVEKRILSWDGYPNQIPTKDNKYIWVDTTARWKVVDMLKFIESVQNERGAKARLDAILDAATRDVVSNQRLVETVRNTNNIFKRIEERRKIKSEIGEEEVTGEIEKIEVGREKLSQLIAEQTSEKLIAFGIELIDVQLRRISYNQDVEKKVYERMISEQNRIAEKIRSIGKGEKAKIEGKVSRDLQTIESQSYEKAREIEGKGEAQAISIYAKAFSKDPQFYKFLRTMEAYKKSLNDKTEYILSTDSEYLKYMRKQ